MIGVVAHPRDTTPERRSPDHLAMTGVRFNVGSPSLKGDDMAPAAGLEPATRRLTGGLQSTHSESLHHDAPFGVGNVTPHDPPCFTVLRDDSSRNVVEKHVEYKQLGLSLPPIPNTSPQAPLTSDDALRLAIKLAIDAGEYERAGTVLDILRRATASAAVTPIGVGGHRRGTSG